MISVTYAIFIITRSEDIYKSFSCMQLIFGLNTISMRVFQQVIGILFLFLDCRSGREGTAASSSYS